MIGFLPSNHPIKLTIPESAIHVLCLLILTCCSEWHLHEENLHIWIFNSEFFSELQTMNPAVHRTSLHASQYVSNSVIDPSPLSEVPSPVSVSSLHVPGYQELSGLPVL